MGRCILVGNWGGVNSMVKRCYHCGYKLTNHETYSIFNTAIGKVVCVCKNCHSTYLRMRAKERKRAALAGTSTTLVK